MVQPDLAREPPERQGDEGFPSTEDAKTTSTGRPTQAISGGPPVECPVDVAPAAQIEDSSRFEIRRVLGSGGFGTVTLAWDNVLQREVAIKQPRSKLKPQEYETYLQEARLAARVHHPGIVVVHDVEVDEHGNPLVVYEYVEGGSLKARLSGAPWPLVDALGLTLDLAEALAEAHKQGLTHRDLKPANILLDRARHPRIADFGLAVEEERQQTLRGEVAGTYAYMSPEQVRGEAHRVDGRTDLWAVGVILYELLTGHHPFPGKHVDDVLDQILSREPRPPRQWMETIPPHVEQVCLKLLAKPIAGRYASAAELAEEVRACLREARGEDQAPPALAAAPLRHGRSAVAMTYVVGAAIVALIGIGALAIALASRSGDSPPTPAVESFPLKEWAKLLEQEPRALRQSDSAIVKHTPGTEFVQSEYPTLLQLGETAANAYSLRLTLQPSAWDNDAGVFLGFGPAENPALDECLLILISQNKNGKLFVRPTLSTWQVGGIQYPKTFRYFNASDSEFDPPADGKATLQIDVQDGRIHTVYFNSLPVRFPPAPQHRQLVRPGKFGLYLDGGSAEFINAAIRVTQPE
jgi:serine/threonine protein kinase